MKDKYIVLDGQLPLKQRIAAILHLGWELTMAELRTRQFQRLLGPIWWIVEPSLMSVVFFFLTNRLNYSTGANHFMFIFIGLTVWRYFARTIENSSTNYLTYTYVIRQVSFPLIAANLAILFTEFVFFCCGLAVILLIGLSFSQLTIGWTYLVLPLLILSQSIFALAISIAISCLGVYVRDIPPPLAIGLNVAFFLSPGIYTLDNPSPAMNLLSWVNPFYYFFPAYRSILINNQLPSMIPLVVWTLVSAVMCGMAMLLYRKLRPNFLRVL
jgi:lipopolysaccharide transport system permease protein